MSDTQQDRRNYFRIAAEVLLWVKPVPPGQADYSLDRILPQDPSSELYQQLQALEHEQSQLLRAIADKDRTIANYLSGTNKKIDLLALMVMASEQQRENAHKHKVTLSEGGIDFFHTQPLESGSRLAIRLTLLPSYLSISVFGQVLSCTPHSNGRGYKVSAEFHALPELKRQALARYVIQRQAAERRHHISNKGEEND